MKAQGADKTRASGAEATEGSLTPWPEKADAPVRVGPVGDKLV